MTDNWDDSDDDWDADDDELDARLGLAKVAVDDTPAFDDEEEDLALKEKELEEKANQADLKKKGTALQKKKQADLERKEEEELARKALALEAELEANMSPEELKALKQRQVEEADHALTDDLFGGVDSGPTGQAVAAAGDTVVLKDLKDHLKHARKVAQAIKVSTILTIDIGLCTYEVRCVWLESSSFIMCSITATEKWKSVLCDGLFERIAGSAQGFARR